MQRLMVFTTLAALAPMPALAQGYDDYSEDDSKDDPSPSGDGLKIGVGIRSILSGAFGGPLNAPVVGGGASVTIDMSQFYVDAILGFLFQEDVVTAFSLVARFFYVLHSAKAADLSVGAGGGLIYGDPPGGDNSTTIGQLEVLLQLRAWIVTNVALTASLGLGILLGDVTAVALGGQLTGSFGLVYNF